MPFLKTRGQSGQPPSFVVAAGFPERSCIDVSPYDPNRVLREGIRIDWGFITPAQLGESC